MIRRIGVLAAVLIIPGLLAVAGSLLAAPAGPPEIDPQPVRMEAGPGGTAAPGLEPSAQPPTPQADPPLAPAVPGPLPSPHQGAIDFQTPRGKVPAEVARRAQTAGVPVLALAPHRPPRLASSAREPCRRGPTAVLSLEKGRYGAIDARGPMPTAR